MKCTTRNPMITVVGGRQLSCALIGQMGKGDSSGADDHDDNLLNN